VVRPRKPTAQKIAEGTYRADRDAGSVAASGAPVPPEGMSAAARTHWDALAPGLAASGVAAECDSQALALLCWWLVEVHHLTRAIDAARAAGGAVAPATYVQMGIATDKFDRLAGRFGLTPSERAKLKTGATPVPEAPVAPRKR
jgi:phage terminase small subunit